MSTEEELETVYANLTATQVRCTELLEETRSLKKQKQQLHDTVHTLLALLKMFDSNNMKSDNQ